MRFSRKKKMKEGKSEEDLAGKDSMEIVNELKQNKPKEPEDASGDTEDESVEDNEQFRHAHTEVMFSKDVADEGLVESEPLCGSLEGLTIPGTCSADESSYSSTNSGHTLLDPPTSSINDKPTV